MNRLLHFLFPARPYSTSESWFLLAFRLLFGILLLTHGIAKWSSFSTLSGAFPDPLGVGHSLSLGLAIFGELICSVGFIFGAFYRLALLPMIFTMCMAFFVIHNGDPFSSRELAFVYLVVFVLMYLEGPGAYALDRIIARRIR